MKEKISTIDIFTAERLSSTQEKAKILQCVSKFSQLVPDKCGHDDPPRLVFDPTCIDELAKGWMDQVHFGLKRRKKAKYEAGIFTGEVPFLPSSFTFGITGSIDAAELTGYLKLQCRDTAAFLGVVDVRWQGWEGASGYLWEFFRESTTIVDFENYGGSFYFFQLEKYLPQLPWATVLGPPYVRMFGRDRVLSSPAAVVEEIAPDTVFIQLTPQPPDVIDDLQDYFDVRRQVKNHLGADAFFEPAKGKGPYRVPDFGLAPMPPRQPLGFIDGLPVIGLMAGRPIVQTETGTKILDLEWKV
ncbi:MAG TPA: hypothetical protein VF595_09045 [Tepidisphaeraceae bacterium]|jgi:hypothetical protein